MLLNKLKIQQQSGFTLVEIAIVLVIIGLLLGGVIKGREMIANTKFKKMLKFIDEVPAAIHTYHDKYNAWPGDDIKAKTHLAGGVGGCVAANIVNGDGDGVIRGSSNEHLIVPHHLACANLIKGSFNGTSNILNTPYGGEVQILLSNLHGYASHALYFKNLAPELAKRIDNTLDDGTYNTGSVRATKTYDAIVDLSVFF